MSTQRAPAGTLPPHHLCSPHHCSFPHGSHGSPALLLAGGVGHCGRKPDPGRLGWEGAWSDPCSALALPSLLREATCRPSGPCLTVHDSRAPDQWGPRASSLGLRACRPATAERRAGGAGKEAAAAASAAAVLVALPVSSKLVIGTIHATRAALTQGRVGVGVGQGGQGGQQEAGEGSHSWRLLLALWICQRWWGDPGRVPGSRRQAVRLESTLGGGHKEEIWLPWPLFCTPWLAMAPPRTQKGQEPVWAVAVGERQPSPPHFRACRARPRCRTALGCDPPHEQLLMSSPAWPCT